MQRDDAALEAGLRLFRPGGGREANVAEPGARCSAGSGLRLMRADAGGEQRGRENDQ
ncbi:hypothetical protein [Methylobacter luteus]|uniref:hypothetical protein n=1 Tax=Methylobacter luteus TaxID=415 RepID=UPI0012DEAA51|nr:hypothetical protein [Methylobacter luteus]